MKNIPRIGTAFFLFFLFLSPHGDRCSAKIYKYKDKDGKWCFTNDPSIVPDLNKAEERNSIDTETIEDLQKKLSEASPPRNKVEEARNATVADLSAVYLIDKRNLNTWIASYKSRKESFEKRLKAFTVPLSMLLAVH